MSEKSAEVLLHPGSSFGRYEIVRRIGRGGMGAVYEAVHTELKKRAAIKALLPPLSENPDLRARFVREGQAAARIRHPHVVDIYDVGELGGVPFLVMEYLEGEDLGAMLAREGRLEIERTADLLVPVLSAIAAAHEESVIHRDLKPANIFLARDRYGELVPKVLDFGISKVTGDRLQEGLTGTGAIFGTPFYMSPEQALGGKSVDARSDQYSLGVIIYQCLTGKRPFEADSMYSILHNIVQGTFLLPRMIVATIPEPVEDIILRAMAKNPGHRFAGVRELGAVVLQLASARTRSQWSHAFPGMAALAPTLTAVPGPGALTAPGPLAGAPVLAATASMAGSMSSSRSGAGAGPSAGSGAGPGVGMTAGLAAALGSPAGPVSGAGSRAGGSSPTKVGALPETVAAVLPFSETIAPEAGRTLPSIIPGRPRDSRMSLALAAVAGLLLSVIVGGVVWFVMRPSETIILDVNPPSLPVQPAALVEPEPVPEPSPEPAPQVEPEPEPVKKKKKKVLTGSNNAPILE